MATCPECGLSSRTDPTAVSVERINILKPLGTFSVAGAQMKASAYEAYVLKCRCGWWVYGQLAEDQFIAQIYCPVCGCWSAHPEDIKTGYCGNCHEFTSGPYGHLKEALDGTEV